MRISVFSDLALYLPVGRHASTQTRLVEPSCSLSLSCFTHVWHRLGVGLAHAAADTGFKGRGRRGRRLGLGGRGIGEGAGEREGGGSHPLLLNLKLVQKKKMKQK